MFEYHLTYVLGFIFLNILKLVAIITLPFIMVIAIGKLYDIAIDFVVNKLEVKLKDEYPIWPLVILEVLGVAFSFYLL